MKASELIDRLEKFIRESGDLDVEVCQDGFSCSASDIRYVDMDGGYLFIS